MLHRLIEVSLAPKQCVLKLTYLTSETSLSHSEHLNCNFLICFGWGVSQFTVEICNDRRDRRSCKICASCVKFSRKQHILFCKNCVEVKYLYAISVILHKRNKKNDLISWFGCIYAVSFSVKVVIIYARLVCKLFGRKIWSWNFFDKSHVCAASYVRSKIIISNFDKKSL